MTVFSFLKSAFIFTSLLALVVFCMGGWKVWSANDFAQTAIVKQGIFRGYHLQLRQSLTRDTSGLKNYRMVEEYLPMFAYEAEGRRFEMTGTDSHFFRHLRGRVNESVKVLVSPDDPGVARLGDAFSLYGNGALMALSSLIFVILPWYGARCIDRWRDAASIAGVEKQTTAGSMIARIGNQTVPVNDVVIVLGGFLLVAGGVLGYAYYFFNKRNDVSLIQTIQAGEYVHARLLASQGRGVDAKNQKGESALILALNANQPDVARAILNNRWVNTHVRDDDGISAIQLATVNGDRQTLALLIEKGAEIRDIKPKAAFHLIRKGDAATLEFIAGKGFDLNQSYAPMSYGDEAVLLGQADVVRLIQKHEGSFKAPSAFVALAANDADALRRVLEVSAGASPKFRGLTLERFAEKIGRTDLLVLTREGLGENGRN
jgi:hypothetical protein